MSTKSTRTALVTGANRGIGLAIAKELAAMKNIRVLAAARSEESALQAAREIGGFTTGVTLDMSDPMQVEEAARAINREQGPVDMLVNNAAVMVRGTGLEIGTQDLWESLQVNSLAPFALIKALLPGMQARGWGRIVNVSSGWGSFGEGLSGPAAYAISKATLNALTFSFSQVLDPNVKINACCPGWVRTRMGGEDALRSVEEGAATPVWLANLPDDGPTGGIFRDCKAIKW